METIFTHNILPDAVDSDSDKKLDLSACKYFTEIACTSQIIRFETC